MGDFRHKRNGIVISEPRNFQGLKITKDFLGEKSDTKINISSLIFAGEEAISIRNRIMNGLSGGVGIFEGEPYEIEVGEVGNPSFIFDGYLDYADNPKFIGCNEVKVSLKKRKGSDWLNDVADGFSFRYLDDIGVITNSDYVKVPYIINYIPDNMQLLMLSISLFMMTKELVQSIKATAEAIADVTDASIPVVGASVGVGAGVVTAWDIGNIILAVIKVVAYIAYTVAIVIAIKNLIDQIIEQLIPKKREHLGISIYTLFKRSCQHLGMTFKSQLLTDRKQWVIIPSKGHKGGEKPTGQKGSWSETGVPSANDSWDTFGDLIRQFKRVFNADFKIVNGEFQFEREDFWSNSSNYIIQDVFTNQSTLQDEFIPNTSEITSNYNITWAYDTQDQNTLDNQEGRVFQAILEPNIKTNNDLINLKNLEAVNIPCSLGVRKENLTRVEKVLKDLGKFVDKLTGVLGGGTNFASSIENRKGSLLLSSHFLTIPKMVVMSGGKLAKDQRSKLGAIKLWNELHYINSFAEINGIHNQYFRYKKVKVKFCMEDFISLLDNNFCSTKEGEKAKIERIEWKVWQDYAIIDYRINKKYTNNLKVKIIQ